MTDITIPTMFLRSGKEDGFKVIPKLHPDCTWITQTAMAKISLMLDGYCFKVLKGPVNGGPDEFLKRSRQVRDGKIEVIWTKLDRQNEAHKLWWEAFDDARPYSDGIYEIIGPDIKNNPHLIPKRVMKRVLPAEYSLLPGWNETTIKLFGCDIEKLYMDIKAELSHPSCDVEGIVIQEEKYGLGMGANNCTIPRACKVKKKDFGIPWPQPTQVIDMTSAPVSAAVPVTAAQWGKGYKR